MNIVAARTAKEAGTLVILDVGGRDEPLSEELLQNVDILSPNEVRLTHTENTPNFFRLSSKE